jgi:hypothetical protein
MFHVPWARNSAKQAQQKTPEAMPPGLNDSKWKDI